MMNEESTSDIERIEQLNKKLSSEILDVVDELLLSYYELWHSEKPDSARETFKGNALQEISDKYNDDEVLEYFSGGLIDIDAVCGQIRVPIPG